MRSARQLPSPPRQKLARSSPYLGDRDRLLPVQVALLAHKPALRLLTPHAHNHIPRLVIRGLVRLALEDDLGTLGHAAVNVQVQVGLGVDDAVTFAGRADMLDRLSATTAAVKTVL